MNSKKHNERVILFFDLCIRIEGACAELYHYYSDIFVGHPDAARVFRKTALEEENHQKQFQLACRLGRNINFELLVDPQRPYTVHKKMQALLHHVSNNPPDLVTALTRAIEMEEQLADLHVETAVTCPDPSIGAMFHAMKGFDREHVLALKRQLAIETISKTEMNG